MVNSTLRYEAVVITASDYYAFGSPLIGRSYEMDTLVGYRFGMNTQEKDDEIYGDGNAVDYGARISDNRLARWLSQDQMTAKYPSLGPYTVCNNNPINLIEVDGKVFIIQHEKGSKEYNKISVALKVLKYTDLEKFNYLNDPSRQIFVAIGSLGGDDAGITQISYDYTESGLSIKDIKEDVYGTPIDATVQRRPTESEQNEQRASCNCSEIKQIELKVEDENNNLVKIVGDKVNITIDEKKLHRFGNPDRSFAQVLAHEAGHSYFNFTKTFKAWVWAMIDPVSGGHGINNPGEKDAIKEENLSGRKYHKALKQAKKDTTEFEASPVK